MQDGTIDYSRYSDADLVRAMSRISCDRFPLNHANLQREVARRKIGLSDAPPKVTTPYTPNEISAMARFWCTLISLALFSYGAHGLSIDDIFVPGTRHGVHFHGLSAWLVAAAMLCLIVLLVSRVVDHYDRRDNEKAYQVVEEAALRWAFGLFFAAMLHRPDQVALTGIRNLSAVRNACSANRRDRLPVSRGACRCAGFWRRLSQRRSRHAAAMFACAAALVSLGTQRRSESK